MKRRNNNRNNLKKREDLHKVNEKITAREVRLVSDTGAELLPIREALSKALEAELDLVEISPNANPPVCKIIDYKKFLFEQKKRQKELKSKQTKVVVKEIRMGPNTEEHDFNFKLNHAKTFLQEGAKVKAYVFFKGRSIVFKDRGEILLLKFAQELEEFGSLEQMPKLEGKKMIMMINPKKK
ncbi:translation initiation factor IF-3 [Crocinitomix catalasitica]|uniref:translation initiation factor IF-3 n=1 Tax=Crocinitomix catalasitica TaxID=184607 RepID=UPI000A04BD13|nr:translation initiation factor IF-3 [Crocinitomix catalasitica]